MKRNFKNKSRQMLRSQEADDPSILLGPAKQVGAMCIHPQTDTGTAPERKIIGLRDKEGLSHSPATPLYTPFCA